MKSQVVEKIAGDLLAGVRIDAASPADLADAVGSIRDRIDSGELVDPDNIRNATEALKANCHFDHTRVIALAWMARHGFDAAVGKHLAQALIDLGAVDEAEQLLGDGLRAAQVSRDPDVRSEIPEYEGLLGRVYKQRYVLTGKRANLIRAREIYMEVYQRNPEFYWHGINAVALRAREEKEKIDAPGVPTSRELASELVPIVKQLQAKDPDDKYLAATLSEAALASGDCEQSELWLYRYLSHPKVERFGLKSYDRQLREIWRANPMRGDTVCADRLSAILTRHIAQSDKRFLISPADVPQARLAMQNLGAGLEKNFLGESTLTVDAIRSLLVACESIGCVASTTGARVGTGFLIEAKHFGLPDSHPPVFVTNAHVISDSFPTALTPETASVTFEMESRAAGKPVFHKVKELLFHSEPGALGVRTNVDADLDVAIVALESLPAGATALRLAASAPLVTSKSKVFVVGHPQGSGLQISLQDSALLDIDDVGRLIHYRTPTDPGSSGSPVFNKSWEVIALHHAGAFEAPRLHGDGTYEANEGILLSAIVSCARAKIAGAIH